MWRSLVHRHIGSGEKRGNVNGMFGMSILSAADTTSIGPGALVVLLLLLVASFALMRRLRVYELRNILGPERLPLVEPATPMAMTMVVAAFTAFIVVPLIYGSIKQTRAAMHGQPTTLSRAEFSAGDIALLSTLPGMIGFVCLLAGDSFSGQDALRRLGFQSANLARGIAQGALGLLIVWPLVFWVMELGEWFYQQVHYQHPMEHDLLKTLGQAHTPAVSLTLVFGASVVAPFFEEYLFRGHLQTLLKRALIVWGERLTNREAEPSLVMAAVLSDIPAPPNEVLAAPPEMPPPPMPSPAHTSPASDRVWQSWAAVILTSMIFAAIHPAWSIPGIFVLALGLGYVYDRTGNLWACITMHLLFNTLSTIQYLFIMPHHA